jgi:tRNA (guanine37-N1)-methyltransferase
VRVDIFTLFPEMFVGPFDSSILKRAVSQGIVNFKIHNIRDYTHDKHHTVDDYAYGGGAGMVMKPDAVFEAVETVRAQAPEMEHKKLSIILLTPQGKLFNQKIALDLVENDWLMFICGHYEGLDERIREHLVTEEISIGDYVLTGGELASMVVVDTVLRLIPGVLGSGESLLSESHTGGLLEYPQYTRPEIFRSWKVPEVLLSGNHAQIARWRREQSIVRTFKRRPDLLNKAEISLKEKELTADLSTEVQATEKDSKLSQS